MKKICMLLVLLGLYGLSYSQLRISTNYRQDGIWDSTAFKWDIISVDSSGTLFEFNKALTTFKHTTATITSTYYIDDWNFDDSLMKYTMKVTSDAGNSYDMIIDGINNCVAFFYWYGNSYVLVRHTIKTTWIKEE